MAAPVVTVESVTTLPHEKKQITTKFQNTISGYIYHKYSFKKQINKHRIGYEQRGTHISIIKGDYTNMRNLRKELMTSQRCPSRQLASRVSSRIADHL